MGNKKSRRLFALILVMTLTGLGTASALKLKLATLAPDGSEWMNQVRQGGDEIKKRTEGRVSLRIYPGGTMGNDQAMLRKIRIGQLHGAMVVSSALSAIDKDQQLYGLPLVFHSYEEVDHVRAKFDEVVCSTLEAKGLVPFGIIEGGFAYILSVNPTTSLADLKGRKAWVPANDKIAQATLEAAGLSPVPLPLSDVLTGLQTKLIDTVAGPPVGAVALQWFTKATYFTDWPILYSYGSIVMGTKALNRLSETDREIVREVLTRISEQLNKRSRNDNIEARKALAKQGVQFVSMSEDGISQW